ncbi:MAG: hypothetical protein AAGA34_15335 [Pseudomonadota bacterium]
MTETLLTLVLAFALGFGTARVFHWTYSERTRLRVSALALLPLMLLFAVFLAFFKGTPEGDDWIWLGVGLVYFWPWYLAWSLGGIIEALIRRRAR